MNRRSWLRRSGAGLAGLITVPPVAGGTLEGPTAEDSPVVLPHPQSIIFGSGSAQLTAKGKLEVTIQLDPDATPEAVDAGRMIASELARRTGQAAILSPGLSPEGYSIRLSRFGRSRSGKETEIEGGYRLRSGPKETRIESHAVGFRYAAATLVQLLQGWDEPRLPDVEIADWPVFPFRAVYVEVTSGACMNLADWKSLIDRAASLKLNTIVPGLYNCWQRPTAVLDAEYFLFPSRRYPDFKTPVRTYARREGQWTEESGLPVMAHEDFLDKVVAYGKAHGVEVCPYFSSLGHNTLIPRLMPEISMKDDQCRPIGYGFCTTCPKTYEVLFNLYDEIIERYARPFGITTFHVGMDEVAHACQCPNCRETWNGEDNFYVDHLIKISRHLKQRGMTRVLVWHDMLHRSGLINKHLESRLAKEGLQGLITLGWWYYGAPREGYLNSRSFGRAFFRPDIRVEAWACPSAGWDTTGLLGACQWTSNQALCRLIRQGKARGANGVISYSNHDPMFEQGYANLAQYAWNATPGLTDTQDRYARWLFAADCVRGAKALESYHDAYGIYAGLAEAFYRHPAPPRLGQAVASLEGPGLEKTRFEARIRALEAAAVGLGEIQARIKDPAKATVVGMYQAEVRRLGSFLRVAFEILRCTGAYDSFRSGRDAAALEAFGARIGALQASLAQHQTVSDALADVRYVPSLPRFIPYETQAQRDVQRFIDVFSEMERRARHGDASYLPEIVITGEAFFATQLGMVLP